MTLAVLARHGVTVEKITDGWHIPGGQFCRPAPLLDEPDWSAAAYWLVLRALLPRQRREALRIPLAPPPYLQGDAAILRYLDKLPEQIDISDTPDLLPPLACTPRCARAAIPALPTPRSCGRRRVIA